MDALQGKRCVVTGAGGFIGRALSERLVAEGARVTGLDSNQAASRSVQATGAQFVLCDTTDSPATARALEDAELVVHGAALVSDWGKMEDFIAVNVRGTRNVLDAAAAAGVERTVHLSSVVTWAFDHHVELDEDAIPRQSGVPYIDTKAASDALARSRGERGQAVVVLRPGDVYGPRSVPWAIRPFEMIRKRQFMLIGGGEGLVLPVYVDDLVDAIVLALTTPGIDGDAVTVWDGEAVTCEQFFSYYAQMLGRTRLPKLPKPLVSVAATGQELVARLTGKPPAFTRNAITFFSRKAKLSNRRAQELLGWHPQVSLDEGMKRTEAWFRSEGLL